VGDPNQYYDISGRLEGAAAVDYREDGSPLFRDMGNLPGVDYFNRFNRNKQKLIPYLTTYILYITIIIMMRRTLKSGL
jgi:hypothetical protein